MKNLNETLPDNLKKLVAKISTQQAIPLGTMSDLPFLAIKLEVEDEDMITQGGIECEIKPSILNIDFAEETVAICFVQLRLNRDDRFIYTTAYDLNIQKQYADCYALLNMKKYGLFVSSDNIHDFIALDSEFEADFDPRMLLEHAKAEASEYDPALFAEIYYGINTQVDSKQALWEYLEYLAPFDKKWYGRMQINKEQV